MKRGHSSAGSLFYLETSYKACFNNIHLKRPCHSKNYTEFYIVNMSELRKIAILGSTGSIGTQALEVIRANPDRFCAEVLVSNSKADLLIQQALEFKPNAVVIADES